MFNKWESAAVMSPHSKWDSKVRRSWLEDKTCVPNILGINLCQNQGSVNPKGQREMRQQGCGREPESSKEEKGEETIGFLQI